MAMASSRLVTIPLVFSISSRSSVYKLDSIRVLQ
jgi:hypothetical protein